MTTTTNEACASDGGRAIRLNGTSGSVHGPSTPFAQAPNTFTISIWFRTAQPQGKLIGFATSRTGQSSQYDRHLYVDTTGRLVFGVYPGEAITVRSTGTVTDNQWHLATATLSSAGMRLYLDGDLAASGSTTTAESYSSAYLRIGYDNLAGWPNPPSGYFNGFLDDAAYWSTALTPAQVKAIYDSRSLTHAVVGGPGPPPARARRPRLVDRPQSGPTPFAQPGRGEHRDHQGAVVHVAGEHGLDDLVERHPAQRHPELLVVARVPVGLGHVAQVAGQEHPQRLVRPARGRVVVEQQVPLPRDEVGLLGSSRAAVRWAGSPATSSRPGGQLPLERAHGVAVLLQEQDPVLRRRAR